MKAEQRKEIETNSLVLAVQRLRNKVSGRTAYYVLGTIALIVAAILLYGYFSGERQKARDGILLELANANTPQKLKDGMEAHRGTIYGSLFKQNLARYLLHAEGLPKLGTDSKTTRLQAANSVEQARTYFLELTAELKEKEEPGLVQGAWLDAAEAEAALVGLPKPDSTTEFRGNVDKAIEYYEKAASIFPETEFSKRYRKRADDIRANKDQFVADQKAIYAPSPTAPPEGTTGTGPIGPSVPPTTPPPTPKGPPIPALPPVPDAKGPPIPALPPVPDAKGPAVPKTSEPKTAPEPKPAQPPKGPEPKAK